MAKASSYAALAAASVAAGDKVFITDVSVPANKNVVFSDVLQAAMLLSTGFGKLASNVLSFGPNGATNPSFQIDGATASVVNGVKALGTITAVAPIVSAIGSDTDISLELAGKGTGCVKATSPTTNKVTQTATTDTATITIAQLLTKCLDATPTAGAAYTMPTAANLVAGIKNCKVGDSFSFLINNKAAGAFTVTVSAGAGGTADGTLTVAQNVIRRFTIIVTNVTGASEAYFIYGEGA